MCCALVVGVMKFVEANVTPAQKADELTGPEYFCLQDSSALVDSRIVHGLYLGFQASKDVLGSISGWERTRVPCLAQCVGLV